MITVEQKTDNCFICITGSGSLEPKTILFYSDSNLSNWIAEDSVREAVRLLYYRRFNTVFDSLAHKLMLENLCDASLNGVISRKNPEWEDLRERLQEELSIFAYDECE